MQTQPNVGQTAWTQSPHPVTSGFDNLAELFHRYRGISQAHKAAESNVFRDRVFARDNPPVEAWIEKAAHAHSTLSRLAWARAEKVKQHAAILGHRIDTKETADRYAHYYAKPTPDQLTRLHKRIGYVRIV